MFAVVNNLGALISCISTLILAILPVASYRRWRVERKAEKLSDIAEAALVDLCPWSGLTLGYLDFLGLHIPPNPITDH